MAVGLIVLILTSLGIFGITSKSHWGITSPLRLLSALFLYASVLLGALSIIKAFYEKALSIQDWGIAFIQLATPILITFVPSRVDLLRDASKLAIFFALADLGANVATALGLGHFSEKIGFGTSYGTHWLGIPGNSFAEGTTALIAVAGLSWDVDRRRGPAATLSLALIAALIFSLWMIRARTDFATSLAIIPVLMFRRRIRLPLAALALIIGGGLLGAVFFSNPYGTDETLRSMLIIDGFQRALGHPVLGVGPHYLKSAEIEVATYIRLSRAGVTESGAIDWAIAYGIPSLLFLLASAFCALLAKRARPTFPAVMLSVFVGNLAIAGGLLAPLTAVLFFSSLIACQREEPIILAASEDLI